MARLEIVHQIGRDGNYGFNQTTTNKSCNYTIIVSTQCSKHKKSPQLAGKFLMQVTIAPMLAKAVELALNLSRLQPVCRSLTDDIELATMEGALRRRLVCNLGWSCLEVWPNSFLLRRQKSNSSLKGLVCGYEDQVAFAGVYVQVIDGERLEIILFSSFSFFFFKKNRGGLGHGGGSATPDRPVWGWPNHPHGPRVASQPQWGGSATIVIFFFFFLNNRFNF
jgi:hypothetical protein